MHAAPVAQSERTTAKGLAVQVVSFFWSHWEKFVVLAGVLAVGAAIMFKARSRGTGCVQETVCVQTTACVHCNPICPCKKM